MSGNCVKCSKNITKGRFPGVKCARCEITCHIKCADISDEILNGLKIGLTTWLCPKCRTSVNNSIFVGEDDDIELQSSSDNPSLSEIMQILKIMQKQLDTFKNSFNFLCKTMDDMKVSITNLSKENRHLNEKLTIVEKKCEEQDIKINFMEAEIDRTNQNLNKFNIVVVGLPSKCDEIINAISDVVDKVGVKINANDILSVKQILHNNQTRSLLKNSYIVTLKTLDLKINILNAFRNKKTLFFRELDMAENVSTNNRIIIMQHLTKFQSKLYNDAKNIKMEHKFQFLWCKENNIYLRKSAGSTVYQISSFNDINRIRSSLHLPDISTLSTQSNGQTGSSA